MRSRHVSGQVLPCLLVKVPVKRFVSTMKSRSVVMIAERLDNGFKGERLTHSVIHDLPVLLCCAVQTLIRYGRIKQGVNKHLTVLRSQF